MASVKIFTLAVKVSQCCGLTRLIPPQTLAKPIANTLKAQATQ